MGSDAPSIFAGMAGVEERVADNSRELDALLRETRTPFVVRGLVSDWPLVRAGKESFKAARQYLAERARPVSFAISIAPAASKGRLFYDDKMAVNFRDGHGKLDEIFAGFEKHEGKPDAPTAYLSSIDIPRHFDGVAEENPHPLGARDPLQSIWIGSATRIAAHNDFPDNLACCAVGRRRFTLFPPDQFKNLYLGPIDNTPAGRAVSMVDFHAPDFDSHPRFAEALAHAQTVELEPGDAIFIPSMWWHHVEGLADFNVLVNFWWRDTPRFLGQPQDALNHAIMAIRDLPSDDRALWRDLFNHYVFAPDEGVTGHIPDGKRGILEPLTAESASRIRAFLLRSLNR